VRQGRVGLGGQGDVWRQEKQREGGLVPTGRGQRGRRDTFRTGDVPGSLTCGPRSIAGGRERGEAWGTWASLEKKGGVSRAWMNMRIFGLLN
jgi:hypothetical protein